jgi:hypothetical protein
VIVNVFFEMDSSADELSNIMKLIGLVAKHVYSKRNRTIENLHVIFNAATFNKKEMKNY